LSNNYILDRDYSPLFYNANEPSPPRKDGKGGDKLIFRNYSTNIIAGKNGEPYVDAQYDVMIPGKINRKINDNRKPTINVFDSGANNVGSVTQDEATSILKNEK
jgi:hypothetical protein